MQKSDAEAVVFEAVTPIGFRLRVLTTYWTRIVTHKHPVMKGREKDIQKTLQLPDEIRCSRRDPNVYLFYTLDRPGRWLCAVAKRLNGEGFLITTYPTDAIKEGERVWPR